MGKHTKTIERKYLQARMKRIAHAEETARRGKKDADDRVVDEEEGRKFERALRERKHRWEQSGQHLERVSVLRPTAAPVFLLLSLSLSLFRARTRARVCRPRDGSGLEGPRTENSSRAERPRACAARKKEEGRKRMREKEKLFIVGWNMDVGWWTMMIGRMEGMRD